MTSNPEKFTVSYRQHEVTVEVFRPAGQTIYRVHIPNMAPVVLHRAEKSSGDHFWTSIPEGKQKVAAAIGPLIEQHLKSIL